MGNNKNNHITEEQFSSLVSNFESKLSSFGLKISTTDIQSGKHLAISGNVVLGGNTVKIDNAYIDIYTTGKVTPRGKQNILKLLDIKY